ncbi:MAG: hypothetical protein MUE60_10345, partial [Candidatus Eisenbacteria bacterium]|nr:hypothetical protein [Candidatus Eisenbacteria bacterium]
MRRSGTLVLCTLGVGDVLLAQPLLAALREGLDGRLVVLARAGSPAQLARRLGIADLVVDYVARWPHRVKGGLTLSPWIAHQHFSLVLTTTGLNPYYSGLMALASNAPDRVSERRGHMTWAWTHVVDVQTGTHTVDRNRSLGQAVGVTAGTVPRMSPSPAEMDRARLLLGDHDVCIAVTPGSNKTIAHKRWPLDKFAALIVRLRTAGAHVVVLGGPDEGDMGRQLTGMTGTNGITEL